MAELTLADATDLDIFSNPCNLRRDLDEFIRYLEERDVKRLVRSNKLSKADYRRLVRVMSDPEAAAEVAEHGDSSWVDYVDGLALKMGFVNYDTKGIYAGYTSSEPSFPDNYIELDARAYQRFLDLSLVDRERQLLDALLGEKDGCRSEFFQRSVLGRLDSFDRWGCATGIVPTLDFPKARRFLLDLLSCDEVCEPGVWYSMASLVQYLKAHHPFFLIPRNPSHKTRWGVEEGRYGNFHESERNQWGSEIGISESEPDAFERVEGRYVERFLEDMPLALGYVDVAYSREPHKGVYPSINRLRAFRINSRLSRAMKGDIPLPQVTVQPNFEIYVESEFYPVRVLHQLMPLADLVSEDVLTILRLQKERVAAQLAYDEGLDVVALLTKLQGRELPPNVARELREWTEHSEKFILYDGFALLEGDEALTAVEPFLNEVTVEWISPTSEGAPSLRIVHSPDALFAHLEEAELVPLRVKHAASSLSPLPRGAHTLFPKRSVARKPKPKRETTLNLMRSTVITLHFPDGEPLEAFRKALLDARCPIKVGEEELTLTFSKRYEAQVTAVIQSLDKRYRVHIEDID